MKNAIKVLYNIVFYAFIAIILMVSIISFSANEYKGVKKIGSLAFCNVLTGSMSPTINPGSLIIVKDYQGNKAEIGDIVTFEGEKTNSIVTHRIVEEKNNGESYVTQGDANDTVDSFPVTSEMIVGKVIFTIPVLGTIMLFIQNNILIVLGAIVLVVVLTEIFKGRGKKAEVEASVKKQGV